jgi:hypothetical protein
MSNLIGPKDHITWLSSNTRLDGITEIRWAMPNGEKRMTVQMTAGPTLLQRTWDLLDAKMEVIMVKPELGRDDTTSWMEAKQQARGIAEVLAMFMVPHFSTADEIAREAVARYKARQSGDTEYETAGLGSRRYEPPAATILERANERRSAPAATKTRRQPVKRAATGNKIPDGAVNTVKNAISGGMFTLAQVAKTYSMTEAEVKSQLGLA